MSAVNASTFTPTNQVVDPPNRPEPLAEAVLASLSRSNWGYRTRAWGLIKTCILSALTFGILPLLIWPKRLRNLRIVEQQQLWHLGEWLRLRTGKPKAAELRDQARNLAPASSLGFLPLAVLAGALFIVVQNFQPQRWYELAYGQYLLQHHHRFMPLWRPPYLQFWATWNLILAAGYFFHWLTVCTHAGAMANYAQKFNRVVAAEGVAPVRISSVGIGLSPLWLIAAFIGLAHGALWAMPMMFAGVVHRRYVEGVGPQIRGELAMRVRSMLEADRPAMAVRPTPVVPSTVCPNEKCTAPIRPGSTFCPRCGTRL